MDGYQRREYAEVRGQMLPGDVIAFGGKGRFSDVIKWATDSVVSHVGIVLHATATWDPGSDRYFNLLLESTSLNGLKGVQIQRVSDRVRAYGGEIWWLPLAHHIRGTLDMGAFWDFAFAQVGKPYDLGGAVRSATRFAQNDDLGELFCSELLAACLEAGGAIGPINASTVTPAEACSWGIYGDHYVQIAGEQTEIPGWATG